MIATQQQSKKPRPGVTSEHVARVQEVRRWLDGGGNGTPLEKGVLDELLERLEHYTRTAAIVRVRALNAGTPPSERARRAKRVEEARSARQALVSAVTLSTREDVWTEADLNRMRQMLREGHDDDAIGEALDRSAKAVEWKRRQFNLKPANTRGTHWTAEDDARLAALVPTHTDAEIGQEMGRTTCAVVARRGNLGIRRLSDNGALGETDLARARHMRRAGRDTRLHPTSRFEVAKRLMRERREREAQERRQSA